MSKERGRNLGEFEKKRGGGNFSLVLSFRKQKTHYPALIF